MARRSPLAQAGGPPAADPRPLSVAELREGYAICGSEDYRNGVQAFLAKSRPLFHGAERFAVIRA
jgi:hypothetical protein